MSEIDHKRKKAKELEDGNQRSFEELVEATQGRFGMDTSDLRREMMLDKLVEWGVISHGQKLDFDIEFHTKVEEALNGAWEKFREAQKPQLSVVKKPSGLLDQHGREL